MDNYQLRLSLDTTGVDLEESDGELARLLRSLRQRYGVSRSELAQLLGTSLAALTNWERGVGEPSPSVMLEIRAMSQDSPGFQVPQRTKILPSRGIRQRRRSGTRLSKTVTLAPLPLPALLGRVREGRWYRDSEGMKVDDILAAHDRSATTVDTPPEGGISAGKNTYTYDAHTYHTKVPPQGILDLLNHYLPSGGLVLDPFAGSGMTGVACRLAGIDCILNELSPAASFISYAFTQKIEIEDYEATIRAILDETDEVRRELYTTVCRECGKDVEILYTVWSYRAVCGSCFEEFRVWDHCRKYGRTVREHKLLSVFPCPHCGDVLKKSLLRRTVAEPVFLGYKCCRTQQQEHPVNSEDLQRIERIHHAPPVASGFYPQTRLPEGVNLRQPAKHGLDSIDRFYTTRNLAAMSHLWRTVNRIASPKLAMMAAFTFTSLYQRVTRLSEYRFWGGSGNTARFNLPFVFNEANVFVTFERKAATILDHLDATARYYRGTTLVACGSATRLEFLPDNSVDFIFTDPPFGANINYSEMNILWESWLGEFTDSREEAIVNKVQGKTVSEYRELMTRSLQECHRVLRPGHWFVMMFMNSSEEIWAALRQAIADSGFTVVRIDSFDKEHSTFKQLVSSNAAGLDLLIHCRKGSDVTGRAIDTLTSPEASVRAFLRDRGSSLPVEKYIHVEKADRLDIKRLYSEWLSTALLNGIRVIDLPAFHAIVGNYVRDLRDK